MRFFNLSLCILLFHSFTTAQNLLPQFGKKGNKHNSWEFGLNNGIINYAGDLNNPKFFTKSSHPCLGIYSQYFITDNISLKPTLIWGQFSGSDVNLGETHYGRNFSFLTNLYQLNTQVVWQPFGHVKYLEKNKSWYRGKLSPYFHIGLGLFYIKPKVNFNVEGETLNMIKDRGNEKNLLVSIPFGSGLRYEINQQWVVGTEFSTQSPFNDYLDGISYAANPKKNDWFHSIVIQFAYRLKYQKDMDKDGIPDEEDLCPDISGFPNAKGCPDRDNDGILDKDDLCPDDKGKIEHRGCPDQDEDGIPDYLDHCPFSQGFKKLNGCPDKDKDGVADYKDLCPEIAGSINARGCPDQDEDGVMDKQDICPTEKGTFMTNGCPVKDWDSDGIPDYADACPDKAGDKNNNGCPLEKTAKNEIIKTVTIEKSQKNEQNTSQNSDEVINFFNSIAKKIDFVPNTTKLKDVSYIPLNQLVEYLKQNNSYKIKIALTCKETDDKTLNLKMAEARTRTIFSFLVKNGITSDRISYQGFGEDLSKTEKNIIVLSF